MTIARGERPKQIRTITTSVEPPYWIGWHTESDALELGEKLAFSDLKSVKLPQKFYLIYLIFIIFLAYI